MIAIEYCTPEQACRLQELGINQNGKYFTHNFKTPTTFIYLRLKPDGHSWLDLATGVTEVSRNIKKNMTRVFSVAELGIVLNSKKPDNIHGFGWHTFFNVATGKWGVSWFYNNKGHQPVILMDTEAEARCAFLLALISENIISMGGVNEVLKQFE